MDRPAAPYLDVSRSLSGKFWRPRLTDDRLALAIAQKLDLPEVIGRVLAVLIVFAVVQAVEGYILTPRIMGERTGLHPLVIIVAIFFWGSALNGIMGMILAIPLTAFLVVFWRLARERYIDEWV